MRERNFNFSDIAAVNKFNRIRFGRKAAAPNLTRTMRNAVEEMKEFYPCVQLQEAFTLVQLTEAGYTADDTQEVPPVQLT